MLAEVDGGHGGELGDAEALGEVEAGVLASLGVGPGLEARGGGGEDDGRAFDGGPQHGHVAGGDPGAIFQFVGRVDCCFRLEHRQRLGQRLLRLWRAHNVERFCRQHALAFEEAEERFYGAEGTGKRPWLDPILTTRGHEGADIGAAHLAQRRQ